jgi:hypothetical protein
MDEDYENSDYEESKEERQARDDRIEEFRQRLAKWKKAHLDEITKDNQQTTALNKYIDDCSDLYFLLRDVLEGHPASIQLRNHSLWKQVGGTQNGFFPVRSPIDRTEMNQVIFRDLVEFPYTFNTKLTNAFPRRNSLEDAEIIPNEE